METGKPLPRLSLSRLVASDYIAFSVTLYPAALWLVFFGMASIDLVKAGWAWQLSTISQSLGYIAGMITLICLPLLGWRILKLNAILKDGVEIVGKVKSLSFWRDRGVVVYTYQYRGKKYQTGATLHKTRLTRALQPGEDIRLIVSKDDPRRAFIKHLYTS